MSNRERRMEDTPPLLQLFQEPHSVIHDLGRIAVAPGVNLALDELRDPGVKIELHVVSPLQCSIPDCITC